MKRWGVLVFAAVATWGCAVVRNPAAGLPPTGEPLAVEVVSGTRKVVEREELVNLGAARASQGSASALGLSIGRDVERNRDFTVVLLKQGLMPVDEQDFYTIAGDALAVRELRTYRDELEAKQVSGNVLSAVGLGLAACGVAGGIGAGVGVGNHSLSVGGGVVLGVLSGFVGFVGLMVAAIAGPNIREAAREELRATFDSPHLPVLRAQAAAEAYNQRLGRTPPPRPATLPSGSPSQAPAPAAPATAPGW